MDVEGQFGDNLVRVRKSAAISQGELSVRASVHRTEASQLERGLRIARIDLLAKLCASLEVEPGELMEGISARAITECLGHEPATLAEFEAVHGAVKPPDGGGSDGSSSAGLRIAAFDDLACVLKPRVP